LISDANLITYFKKARIFYIYFKLFDLLFSHVQNLPPTISSFYPFQKFKELVLKQWCIVQMKFDSFADLGINLFPFGNFAKGQIGDIRLPVEVPINLS
jgi:hypothetical protein